MVGQQIGNYRVTRKIGDGGMGSVFEAVHEGIGRRVAVKVLHPTYSQDQGVLQRFFNEARAVNIVQQPGIVGVFDYGQLPDGRAYLIMEYLEGEPLSTRVRRLGRLGLDALRIGRQLAGTLAAAHQKGITHRDLKPDNIIMVPDPEAPGGERAKVLDFGIAKITTEHAADSDSTQAGTVMGTPKYMAPEQCQGAADVGPKADVYALGVVLFELLSGRLPFTADSPGALLAAHRHKAPPQLTEIDPSTPPQIEALVQAMLTKDPATRPHMAEVAASLEYLGAWLSGSLPMAMYGGNQLMASGGAVMASGGYGALSGPSAATPVSPQVSPTTGSQSRPSLSGMAGQSQSRAGRPMSRLLLPSALMMVVFALVLVGMREVRHRRSEEPGHAAAGAPRVRWQVQSQPAGAQVVRISDDRVLGQTPLRLDQESGSGQVVLVLRKEGFFDHQVRMELGRDQLESVALDPVPVEGKPATASKPVESKPATASKPAADSKPATDSKPAPAAEPAAPRLDSEDKGHGSRRSHRSRKKTAPSQETPKDDDTDLAPIR